MENAVTALFLFYRDLPWPKQLGGPSVHSASDHVVLLQSASEEHYRGAGHNRVQPKLHVICKECELSGTALEPGVTIPRSANVLRRTGSHDPGQPFDGWAKPSLRELDGVRLRPHAVSKCR